MVLIMVERVGKLEVGGGNSKPPLQQAVDNVSKDIVYYFVREC